MRAPSGRRKAGFPTRICLVSWECGQRVRRGCIRQSATELMKRIRDWIQKNGGRGGDLQVAFLSPGLQWPVSFHGIPAAGGGCDKQCMSEEQLQKSVSSTGNEGRRRGALGHLLQCQEWDQGIGNFRSHGRGEDLQLADLFLWPEFQYETQLQQCLVYGLCVWCILRAPIFSLGIFLE